MTNEPPSISGGELSWTQPMCEACWVDQNKVHGDDGVFSVRVAVTTTHGGIQFCAFCGRPTIWGCFVRRDPTTVPYPARKSDDE